VSIDPRHASSGPRLKGIPHPIHGRLIAVLDARDPARLARDGDPEPIHIEDTDTTFAIEWKEPFSLTEEEPFSLTGENLSQH
jgi:hypothetical protein